MYRASLTKQRLGQLLQGAGVKVTRVRRAVLEIERKTFHITGLIVPLTFNLVIEHGHLLGPTRLSRAIAFIRFSWLATACIWVVDVLRLASPTFAAALPMRSLLREHERTQLTGTCWFSLGCSLVMTLFDDSVATASILMLVLGDMTAALIGVAFGGETVVVKLGREGKKSVEGSVAMFCVCIIVGTFVFGQQKGLPEYAVVVGSMVATITELYTDDFLGLDDNITIPLFTSTALAWGLRRTSMCGG